MKINFIKLCTSLLLISLLLSSCIKDSIKGDGNIVIKEIPISDYDKIEITGKTSIEYEYKPAQPPYLRIEIDENLFSLLDIKSDGQKLSFKFEKDVEPTAFKIYTNSTTLKEIEGKGNGDILLKGSVSGTKLNINIKGVSNIVAEDIRYEELDVDISGQADLRLKGLVNYSEYEIKGQANVDAFDLVAQKVKCDIAGNGNMQVNTIQQLDINIKGSGEVIYTGNPPIINQKIQGSGRVSAK